MSIRTGRVSGGGEGGVIIPYGDAENLSFLIQSKLCAVIGGCGFLGHHIVDKLLEKGYQVNVFDIRKTFEDARVHFFIGDLCNKEVRKSRWG